MKDTIAFASVVVAALVAVIATCVTALLDPGAGSVSAGMYARSLPNVGEPQARRIEPVTVIGHRDPPEQQPNNLAIAPASDVPPRKTQSATNAHDH